VGRAARTSGAPACQMRHNVAVMGAGTVPRRAPEGGLWGASPALLRLASDAELIRLIRSGNRDAFEAAYDRHHGAILRFCAQLLGDRHEAEDATQQAFLSAYDAIVTRDQPIQLRPWLYAIARNRCLSMLRGRREVAVAECEQGASEGPAAVVVRREALRDLMVDVNGLPADQRAALVMAELGAFSHEEIAVALEVPRDRVKALVFQARESLVATRDARETDCAEIRLQLSTLRGPALRKGHLRRHLHGCAGCREYRRQLRRQRPRLAAVTPLGLFFVLRRALGGGRATASGGGAVSSSTAVKLVAVKPVVGAVVAALGATSAVVVVRSAVHHPVARLVARVQPVSSGRAAADARTRLRESDLLAGAASPAAGARARGRGEHRADAARAIAGPLFTGHGLAAGRASWTRAWRAGGGRFARLHGPAGTTSGPSGKRGVHYVVLPAPTPPLPVISRHPEIPRVIHDVHAPPPQGGGDPTPADGPGGDGGAGSPGDAGGHGVTGGDGGGHDGTGGDAGGHGVTGGDGGGHGGTGAPGDGGNGGTGAPGDGGTGGTGGSGHERPDGTAAGADHPVSGGPVAPVGNTPASTSAARVAPAPAPALPAAPDAATRPRPRLVYRAPTHRYAQVPNRTTRRSAQWPKLPSH